MPLQEMERPFSQSWIDSARAIPMRQRPEKALVVLYPGQCDSLQTFLKRIVGVNVVVPGPLGQFHRDLMRLLGASACKLLVSDRRIAIDGVMLQVSGREMDFFVTRKGNVWGSIYAIGWSPEDPVEWYRSTLTACQYAGWNIDRLMPPGQMAGDLLRRKVYWGSLPDIRRIDYKHIYRAYQCIKPPVLEACSLGKPDDVVRDYDINWAFSSVLKDLPSFNQRLVRFVESDQYQKDAIDGYLYCEFYIRPEAEIGPLCIRIGLSRENYRCFNPVGSITGFATKREIDMIRDLDIGRVKILQGTWIIPIFDQLPYPFKEAVGVLQSMYKIPELRRFVKSMSPILWGKLASSWGSTLFNPFYAASIGSVVRERVLRLTLQQNRNIVAVTADGLVATSDLPVMVSSTIGDMKMAKREVFISLSDLYRYMPDKNTTWTVEDDGIVLPEKKMGLMYVLHYGREASDIGNALPQQKIPFGSSRRCSPPGLRLVDLERGRIELDPPDEEAVANMVFIQNDGALVFQH